ncbi:Uncharacterized protein C19C2.10 [Choanephora cucurbitarum]|uniref:Uncharacterized protein C19C2.10 n=1 Tax=Choanephora cucurbitarum TaxID=101091 RepID=A0A1C7NB46_9FUNG|nr:Uncharacterized protein C19C2.10 [Choanephora cucurbitarum]
MWTGERFGGAKVTLQTEDFQKLEEETDHRRDGYENVVESVELVHSYLLKKKTSPEDAKVKMMPFEILGTSLYHYGSALPDESALGKSFTSYLISPIDRQLGIALINLGQAETRIAALQEAFAYDIKTKYMNVLSTGLLEYKEYDSLRKKLTSRRLDYDSKLNRLNKAKKEKPELEQEMQAARMKYEDTEHDLIQKMAYLQEFEEEHRDALLGLIEAQCTYHAQAKELLEAIKKNWGQGLSSDPCEFMGNVMVRPSESTHPTAVPTASIAEDMGRKNSVDTFVSTQQSKEPIASTATSPLLPTPSLLTATTLPSAAATPITTTSTSLASAIAPPPATATPSIPMEHPLSNTDTPSERQYSGEYEKYRKALFDFNGQNDDEISFKTGEIIAVINEIDKGWWLGEVHSKRGIFPVNYTEEYLKPVNDNLHEARERSSITVERDELEQHQLSNPRVAEAYSNGVTSPTITSDTLSVDSSVSSSSSRRPLPPPATTSSPVVFPARTSSLSRKRSTVKRAPPPPPPLRVAATEPPYIKPASVHLDSSSE